jgi:transposase-like protein
MGAKAARNDTKQKGGHMNKKQAYQCVKCGKTVEATGGKPEVSDCCAEPLKQRMKMNPAMTEVREMLK